MTETGLELHTLDGRDNALLDVSLGPQHGFAGQEVRRQIGISLNDAIAALAERGINYPSLRTALTPQVAKKEIALIFDSSVMDGWYGYEAGEAILPLLNKSGNHSILTGDIIWKDQDFALQALNQAGTFWRAAEVVDVSQLFCVYINNLSPAGFSALRDGLAKHPAVLGFVDCTFSSAAKSIFATCIGTTYVKLGSKFISSHPYDSDPGTNENGPGWPVEKYGYTSWSIDDMSFGLFLSYKIESAFAPLAFNDGHFSLVAATGVWGDPRELEVSVDYAKREYLERHKLGSLAKAGLANSTNEELAAHLQDRLARSYIFSLVWNSELNYSTFATMVEFEHEGQRSRLRAALKFENGELGLVTLFG